jgi:hypothetical protein
MWILLSCYILWFLQYICAIALWSPTRLWSALRERIIKSTYYTLSPAPRIKIFWLCSPNDLKQKEMISGYALQTLLIEDHLLCIMPVTKITSQVPPMTDSTNGFVRPFLAQLGFLSQQTDRGGLQRKIMDQLTTPRRLMGLVFCSTKLGIPQISKKNAWGKGLYWSLFPRLLVFLQDSCNAL